MNQLSQRVLPPLNDPNPCSLFLTKTNQLAAHPFHDETRFCWEQKRVSPREQLSVTQTLISQAASGIVFTLQKFSLATFQRQGALTLVPRKKRQKRKQNSGFEPETCRSAVGCSAAELILLMKLRESGTLFLGHRDCLFTVIYP